MTRHYDKSLAIVNIVRAKRCAKKMVRFLYLARYQKEDSHMIKDSLDSDEQVPSLSAQPEYNIRASQNELFDEPTVNVSRQEMYEAIESRLETEMQ